MNRRAIWHPETQRIYLPSGFVVTMPRPVAEDRKQMQMERMILQQTMRSVTQDEVCLYPHPCTERMVNQMLSESKAQKKAARHKQIMREYAERKAGLRGACPHELPDRRLQTNVGRDEKVDMIRRMEQHGKANESMNLDCGLCVQDYCRARRWMKGEGVELLDVLPASAATAKACNRPPAPWQ